MVLAEQLVEEQPGGPLADWASSGAMWLTGRRDGAPQLVPGTPATAVRAGLDQLRSAAESIGVDASRLPDHRLLGERAAVSGMARRGRVSAGGATRLLDASDGVVAIAIARPSDLESLPALTETTVDGEPWDVLARWCSGTSTADIIERATLLGMACGSLTAPSAPPGPRPESPGSPLRHRDLVIVDLSALWAGPLAAHLLHLLGARVIGVESGHRPDPSRHSQPAFHGLLHAGTEQRRIDFRTDEGIAELRRLLESADIVIESSRPRALEQLGIDARSLAQAHDVTWLSITAYGRDDPRIGFGDDVAIAAGLVGAGPVFAGDAIADPMTGVQAALVGWTHALAGLHGVIEVVMHDVVAASTGTGAAAEAEVVHSGEDWYVDAGSGLIPVARPAVRSPA